ncbi:MAG TPA: protein kinase, partial [Gemmata sp.]
PPEAVVLTDFGLARGDGKSFTQTGTFFGTFYYASPEQLLSAKDVDHRTDLYSAGVLLFRLIAGRFPFQPPMSALPSDHRAVRLQRLFDLEDLRPDAPQLLGDICRNCLQSDPANRYPDARELAHDLEIAIEQTRPV